MIFKYVFISLLVSISSFFDAVHKHGILMFLAMLGLYLATMIFLMRREPVFAKASIVPAHNVQLQEWAKTQHTSFNFN